MLVSKILSLFKWLTMLKSRNVFKSVISRELTEKHDLEMKLRV